MARRKGFHPGLWDALENRIALSSAAASAGSRVAEVQSATTTASAPSYEELTTTYANGNAGDVVGVGKIIGTTQTEYRLTVPSGSNTTTTTELTARSITSTESSFTTVRSNRLRPARPPVPAAQSRTA